MFKNIIDINGADVYINSRHILKSISLSLKEGHNTFVIGPNGSGKTTLTKLIMGYIWPRYGATVSVLGETYGQCDIFMIRRKIAWISPFLQGWTSSVKDYTSEEIIVSGIDSTIGLYRKPLDSELALAAEILRRLGSEQLIGKSFNVLSSGEQIIVLTAKALIKKPEILILDEVCAHLDLYHREQVLEIIDAFAKSDNAPFILFITQRIEDITDAFDNGIAMKNGSIMFSGNKDYILSSDRLKDIFDLDIKLIKTSGNRYWPVAEKIKR